LTVLNVPDVKRAFAPSFKAAVFLLFWFFAAATAYHSIRTAAWPGIFGGDTANISQYYPGSFGIRRSNVSDFDAMTRSILNAPVESALENPHAFVHSQLSDEAKLALSRFVEKPMEPRRELDWTQELNRSLIDKPIHWPDLFKGPPLISGRTVTGGTVRDDNLRSLAAVYPITLPATHMSKAFRERGFLGGLSEINWKGFFNLSQPTRYTPLTNLYTTAVQNYLMSGPDKFSNALIPAAVLFGSYALIVLLFSHAILRSWRWSVLAAFFILSASSTIAASYMLFSLPYLLVPLAMAGAFVAYQSYKRTGSLWRLGWFVVICIIAPWLREFGAAIPFIVIAAELLRPRKDRSWVLLGICVVLAVHGMFPSLLPKLLGLNDGLVIAIVGQENTQRQLRPFMNLRLFGLIFIQFPPILWILATAGLALWLKRAWACAPGPELYFPLLDIHFGMDRWYGSHSNFGKTREMAIRYAPLLLIFITAGAFVYCLMVWAHAAPNWSANRLLTPIPLAAGTLGFLGIILLATLRFSTLLPVIIGALTLPYLFMELAEVHVSFITLPLGVILIAWIRELICLGTTSWPKTKNIVTGILLFVALDQSLNIWAAYAVQRELSETNREMADWFTTNAPKHSVVIANFFNYTDIHNETKFGIDPYESVANNPLGIARSIDTVAKLNAFIEVNKGLRDIFILAGNHDFYSWQAGYHRHKWVKTPPGDLKLLTRFEATKTYPYLDPFKALLPRQFVNFPGYMDWGTDFYFNNKPIPFLRTSNARYDLYRLENPESLKKIDPRTETLLIPTLIMQSVGPHGDLNIVRYGDLFYAVPQRLGAVDWGSGTVAGMPGVRTASSREEIMRLIEQEIPAKPTSASKGNGPPVLIEESAGPAKNFNVVLFRRLYYAVPQRLGAVDWKVDNVVGMPGVRTASSRQALVKLIEQSIPENPTVVYDDKSLPILIEESVGPAKNLNIVRFRRLYYAVPQRLGAVDWEKDVKSMPGVLTAPSRDRLHTLVKNAEIEDSRPILIEQGVGFLFWKKNFVRYRGLYYSIPQSLGSVDLMKDDVAGMDGVVTAPTLESLKAKLR
jgi:hypothetical protein